MRERLLDCSLEDTSRDDFTIANSFLNNLMKIAAYGRAFKYTSAPRSAPEKSSDKYDIGGEVYRTLHIIHSSAKEAGFGITVPEE